MAMSTTPPSEAPAATEGSLRAVVDAAGRFVGGDDAAFARLGLDPGSDAVRVPAHRRAAWESCTTRELCRIIPGQEDGTWVVDVFTVGADAVARPVPSPQNLSAFARSADFSGTIENLSVDFAAGSGLRFPIVVLIDPSGDPTFAGGPTQDHRTLAAMEQCRRASAPMAIWQAFEERRVIVDPRWIETAKTDDRFIAIRSLFTFGTKAALMYVTIPLRNDRAVIGVVAGFWPAKVPITAEHVQLWLSLADELAIGAHFSELLRRAEVNGAEAERIRINDDIHAGLAQSIFALSLEVARASAGTAAPRRSDLEAIQTMADELSEDVRVFLSDGRPGSAGNQLARQLEELTQDLLHQTGASVIADHLVDWDEYSNDFADYVARVVAEAFRNIAKHSSATRIVFRSWISVGSKEVVIEIADDGGNEAGTPVGSAGAGLSLIRELTARWGGRVEFETTEAGATLTIQVVPEYQSEWAVAQRMLQTGSHGEPGSAPFA